MSSIGLLVPLALALLAEAAWIAVLAGLLEAFALHDPVTGVPELLLAAVVGLLAARTFGPRLGDRWSRVAVGLAFVAGLVGWLASPEVRAILRAEGTDGLGPALAANPGGWLAALAFVRGMAHARLPVDQQRVGTLLALGVPGMAVAALAGGMITEPWRTAYLAAAQGQVLLFLVSGIGALSLARLSQVGRGALVDWRRNPAWLLLLFGLVAVTGLAAVWIGTTAGNAIATAVGALIVPLLAVGFVLGFTRRSLRIMIIALFVVTGIGILVRAFAPGNPLPPSAVPPPIEPPQGNPDAQTSIAIGGLVIVLLVAVVAVMLLARFWLRRSNSVAVVDDEERVIDRGGDVQADRGSRRRRPRFGRPPRPTDALGAYLALLASLDGRRPVARGQGETPSEHARRLRQAGHGTMALDLLAADVGLITFGRIDLGEAEHRRAVARADTARAALLAVPEEREEPVAAARTAPTGPVTRGGAKAAGPGADITGDNQPGSLGAVLTRIRRGP